ncbi:MAG: PLP-dependent aminotransferase family protein [Acidobacteria bacterium]|nr:PLP-dependent aminotransferase family protein [Acidobacteriota bacterium]
MSVELASRMAEMRTSEIREILKLTQRPGMISFAGGMPAAELFPVERVARVTEEVLARDGYRALQYSTTEGDPALREAIVERMNQVLGTDVRSDEILITSGSQQGLDLSGKLFLDEGDVVLCESPTYLGAINALRAYRPRFVEVPTDDEGMVITELERRLAENDRVKLVYVVPEFQNPTGHTWSLERRQAFLEVIARHDLPVLEDSPYAELRFEGAAVPSLKTLDTNGLVVFLGTFSKTFCPGLRVGWLAAERALRERYVMVKQGADLHTSTLCQRQVAVYLELFDLEADIERIRDTYRRRRDIMLRTMEEAFPPGIVYNRPQGGMFLWVELPDGTDARKVLERSLEQNVAFVPGSSFYPNGGHENTMRLNFSAMPEERIRDGVRRLAQVLGEVLEEAGEGAVGAEVPAAAGRTLGR